jgi:antitoxin (DNA-binding transcriptional repressor) of toxin-antitoxin stability system
MAIVTVPKADTELSDILARAEAGEEIILARDDKPVMKLVPIETVNAPVRGYGRFEHLRDEIPDDLFLTPMSEDELAAWEGKYSFPGDNGE